MRSAKRGQRMLPPLIIRYADYATITLSAADFACWRYFDIYGYATPRGMRDNREQRRCVTSARNSVTREDDGAFARTRRKMARDAASSVQAKAERRVARVMLALLLRALLTIIIDACFVATSVPMTRSRERAPTFTLMLCYDIINARRRLSPYVSDTLRYDDTIMPLLLHNCYAPLSFHIEHCARMLLPR